MYHSYGSCTQFEIEGFRQFKKRAVVPIWQINLFIGPNGSGKSTLLRLIRLFNEAVHSGEIEHIPTDLLHKHDLVTKSEAPFQVSLYIQRRSGIGFHHLTYEIQPNYSWKLIARKGGIITPKDKEKLLFSALSLGDVLPANSIRPSMIRITLGFNMYNDLDSSLEEARIRYISRMFDNEGESMERYVALFEAFLQFCNEQDFFERGDPFGLGVYPENQPAPRTSFINAASPNNGIWSPRWKEIQSWLEQQDETPLTMFSNEAFDGPFKPLHDLLVGCYAWAVQQPHLSEEASLIESHLSLTAERRVEFVFRFAQDLDTLRGLVDTHLLLHNPPLLLDPTMGSGSKPKDYLVMRPGDLGQLTSKVISIHQSGTLSRFLLRWLEDHPDNIMETHEEDSLKWSWTSSALKMEVNFAFDFLGGAFEISVFDAGQTRPLPDLSHGEQRALFIEMLLESDLPYFLHEPENGMHPAMQEEMGRILIESHLNLDDDAPDVFARARKIGPPLFFETHSDHMLIGVQRAMGKADEMPGASEDIIPFAQIIEVVENDDGETTVDVVPISSNGETRKILDAGFFSRSAPTLKFLRDRSN